MITNPPLHRQSVSPHNKYRVSFTNKSDKKQVVYFFMGREAALKAIHDLLEEEITITIAKVKKNDTRD